MATLTVRECPTTDGAAKAEDALVEPSKQDLIGAQDAAIVYWHEGAKKPKTRQPSSLRGSVDL